VSSGVIPKVQWRELEKNHLGRVRLPEGPNSPDAIRRRKHIPYVKTENESRNNAVKKSVNILAAETRRVRQLVISVQVLKKKKKKTNKHLPSEDTRGGARVKTRTKKGRISGSKQCLPKRPEEKWEVDQA